MKLQKNNDIRKNFSKIFDKDELKRIDNIILYIRSSEYASNIQEEILYDVLIMLKDAKDRGDSIDNTIGDNDEKFLKEIFKNISQKKEGIVYYIFYVLSGFSIFHLIYIGFKNGFGNIFSSDFYLSELVLYPVIFLSVLFVLKMLQRTVYNKKANILMYVVVELGLGLILFLVIYYRKSQYNYNLTSKWLLFASILFFTLGYIFQKKKK